MIRYSVSTLLIFLLSLILLNTLDLNFWSSFVVSTIGAFTIYVFLYTKDLLLSTLLTISLTFPFTLNYPIASLKEYSLVGGVFVNYLHPTIYLLDLLVLLLLSSVIWVLYKKKIQINRDQKLLIYISFIYYLSHNLLHFNIVTLYSSSRLFIYSLTVIISILVAQEIYQKISKYRRLLIGFITTTVLLQALIGHLQFRRGTSVGLTFLGESKITSGGVNIASTIIDGDLFLRAYGTFQHPNIAGGFFTLIFILLLVRNINVSRIAPLTYLFGMFLLLCSYITFSHSSIIVYVLTTILFIIARIYRLFSHSTNRMHSFTPLSILFSTGVFDTSAFIERKNLLTSTIELLRVHWLIGVGAGRFVEYFYPFAPIGVAGITLLQPVHNIFILFLSEHGVIIGGIILSLLSISIIVKVFRSESPVSLLFPVIFILVIGNLDHYLLTLPHGIFLLMISLFIIFTDGLKVRALT